MIYHRWVGKAVLVDATLLHESAARVVDVPNTGTLRGDLVAMMRAANRSRIDLQTGPGRPPYGGGVDRRASGRSRRDSRPPL
ncbi:hypothetical protein [Amycolatopsis iheyensis]|uniref:hypothetical protein n=1 Tax=Amycolatopsis iheyensis TaxID=2945988 RepID=UPI0027E254C4|nr:hypothetical protein [Amycolatopsis iheyensis]